MHNSFHSLNLKRLYEVLVKEQKSVICLSTPREEGYSAPDICNNTQLRNQWKNVICQLTTMSLLVQTSRSKDTKRANLEEFVDDLHHGVPQGCGKLQVSNRVGQGTSQSRGRGHQASHPAHISGEILCAFCFLGGVLSDPCRECARDVRRVARFRLSPGHPANNKIPNPTTRLTET